MPSTRANSVSRAEEEQRIKAFFEEVNNARANKAASTGAGPTSPSCVAPTDAMHAAVHRRIPKVIWKTRLAGLNNAAAELAQEFRVVAGEIGLDRFKPEFAYGEYVTLLLYEAANRLRELYDEDRRVNIGLPDGDIVAEVAEADEKPDGERHTPLQTIAEVEQVLAELSDTLQRTAHRVWFDGRKIVEVAAEEQVRANTIALRLHRVRCHLMSRMRTPQNFRRTNRGKQYRRTCGRAGSGRAPLSWIKSKSSPPHSA